VLCDGVVIGGVVEEISRWCVFFSKKVEYCEIFCGNGI